MPQLIDINRRIIFKLPFLGVPCENSALWMFPDFSRLWFACHCDSSKLTEMPRVEKPIDGEKVLKFSCRDFLKALYELKSKCQTSAEKIVVKMMREYGTVKEALDFDWCWNVSPQVSQIQVSRCFTMFHGFRSKKHVQLGSQYVWVVWGAKWRYSPDDIVGLSSGMVNSDFDWSHENESPAATYHDKTSWSRNAENSWSHICWINFPSRRIIHSLHLVDPTKKRCNEPQSKKWQTFANKN